jgi:DNA-binding transcriptional regulator YiaG
MNLQRTTWTAERIHALRRKVGLTQEEFAHLLGCTTSSVNRWERGHKGPSRLARIALTQLEHTTRRRQPKRTQLKLKLAR